MIGPRHARSLANVRLPAFALAWAVLLAVPAAARPVSPVTTPPSSRAELIARAQAEKARQLRSAETSAAERVIAKVEDLFIEPRNGFFPVGGSIHPGGGLALGGLYRRWYADDASWTITTLYSVRNYKLIEAGTISAGHAGGRLSLALNAGWRDATQVGYYGLGMATLLEDRADYRFMQTYAGGRAALQPVSWAVLGAGVSYEDYRLKSGQGRGPSTEDRYTAVTAPGLGSSPGFVHTDVTAAVDRRISPGYSRRGGYYGVTVHDYRDRKKALSFRRLDADTVQHVPILRETWVLSLRGRVQTTLGERDVVPYFLLPSLGGGTTLRGYPSWRFRDRHSLLGSVEWRWIPNRLALDLVFFYDAGKVTSNRADLNLRGLKGNVGVGARFHGPTSVPLRFDLARGGEGWYLVVAGGAAF